MEIRHIRYFLEITRDMNMTKAAERLHMSQPPLSRQIKQLEEELGAELFERNGKTLRITSAGSFFATKAQQVLNGVNELEAAMKRIGKTGHRWLNIGFVPSTIYGFLPELIRHYKITNPKLEISLSEYMSYDQLNALKAGHIDVGFGRVLFDDAAVIQEVVLKEELVAVVPKDHPLAKKSMISINHLENLPLILYPTKPRPNYADQITSLFYKVGMIPNVIQEVQELQTTLGLVASGIGISIVPITATKMRSGDVAYIPFKESDIMTSNVVMTHRTGDIAPELQLFIKRVRLLSGISRQRKKVKSSLK